MNRKDRILQMLISDVIVGRMDLETKREFLIDGRIVRCWIGIAPDVTVFQSVLYLAGLDKKTTNKKDIYIY